MTLLEVFFIAAGLSMDNMAVAAAASCGGRGQAWAQAFKMAAAFAGTGIICLIIGWFGGSKLERFISAWDHWLAFLILCFIGAKMIKESFEAGEGCKPAPAVDAKTMLTMALATNIDVLAVGVSLGLYEVAILPVLLVLALCVAAATVAGFFTGRKLGAKFGKKVELLGGLVLIAISLKILLEGILA